jgi:hypothetical protein
MRSDIKVPFFTLLSIATTSLLVLGQAVNTDVSRTPRTVLAAEQEGAAFPREATPVSLPGSFNVDAVQGTDERKCVEFPLTMGAISRRSGEFVVGGGMGSFKAGVPNKVWWAPLHDPASRKAVLVVRSARLDEPSITSDFRSSQYAWPVIEQRQPITASVVDREHAFYPSGISLP